ncbi:MAG: hypothetical protein IJX92_01815 [Clostridia bacterium]|nr:hypothetical protein [Clostridia bacterium]
MKKFRLSAALAVISLLVVSLFGCTSNKEVGGATDEVIYAPRKSLTVINGEGAGAKILIDFTNSLGAEIGSYLSVKGADTPEADGQIIVGRTGGELSKQAYAELEKLKSYTENENHLGFVIYSDGRKIAVAFDSDDYGVEAAQIVALEYIVNNCIDGDKVIKLAEGKVTSGLVDYVEYQERLDEVTVEKQWASVKNSLKAKLSEKEAEEVYNALVNHYKIYSDDVISWFANLYEPTEGGWYYSNSGRNTIGYLPDIESTGQALDFISGSGMIDEVGALKTAIPEWMQEQIVYFVKSRQDENGYFYHPQWTKAQVDGSETRKGRDLGKAEAILKSFGNSPTYDTANGTKGDGIPADGTRVSPVSMLAPLKKTSAVTAVSKVIAVSDDAYVEARFVSAKAFSDYLKTLDINASPYKVSSILSTQISQIKKRDQVLKGRGEEGLENVLFTWLETKQNPKTGLWTTYDYADYEGVNGLLKISGAWSTFGRPFPYVMEAISSTLEVIGIMNPDDVTAITDIYNTWYAVLNLVQNIESYNTSLKENLSEVRSEILKNAVKSIKNTTSCIAAFIKPDGSISYSKKYSSPTSSEMIVALPNQVEGDINATELGSVGTTERMFRVLGLSMVSMYTKSDFIRYMEIVTDLNESVKDEVPNAEPLDYEDSTIGQTPEGFTKSISSSGDVTVEMGRDGNVLRFESKNNGYDYVVIPYESMYLGAKTFICESDFLVESSDAGYISHITIHDGIYMIGITVKDENGDEIIDENDGVYLHEESAGESKNSRSVSLGRVAAVGEWFKLRVEYYSQDRANIRIKIYINETLIAVSDNWYSGDGAKLEGGGKPSENYRGVRVAVMSTNNTTLLMDNTTVTKTSKQYEIVNDPQEKLLINVDAPDKEEVVYDFANGIHGDLTTDSQLKEIDGTSALDLQSGSLKVPVTVRTQKANCGVADLSLTVDESTAVGAKYELVLRTTTSVAMVRVHLIVEQRDGVKYLALHEASSGATGAKISGFEAPIGKKFTIRVEYFGTMRTALIYLDKTIVATLDAFCQRAINNIYGELTFANISADGVSGAVLVHTVKAERDVVSYDEVTEPTIPEKVYDFTDGLGDCTASGAKLNEGKVDFGQSSSGSQLKVPVNKRSPVISAVILEADFTIAEKQNSEFRVAFTNEDGHIIAALDFVTDGDVVKVYEVTEQKVYNLVPLCSFEQGSGTLRIEYSAAKDAMNVVLNGKTIGTTSLVYKQENADLSCDYVTATSNKANTALTLDNVKAECYNMYFAIGKSDTASPEKNKAEITFEETSTGNVKGLFRLDFRSGSANLRVKEMIIDGAASKVLEYTTSVGGNDSLYIPVIKADENTNRVAFEADIAANFLTKSDAVEVYFMAGNQYATKMTLQYSSGSVILSDNTGGATYISKQVAKAGKWFKLRMEYQKTDIDYTGDGIADVLVKVYIDGVLIGTGYNAYNNATYTSNNVNEVRLYTWSDANCTILLDNIKTERLAAEPDPLPEIDEGLLPGKYFEQYGGNNFNQYTGNVWTDIDKRNEIDAFDKIFARNNGITDAAYQETGSYIIFNTEIGGKSLRFGKNTTDKTSEYYFKRQGGEGKTFIYETSLKLVSPSLTADDTAWTMRMGFTQGIRTTTTDAIPTFYSEIKFYAKADGTFDIEAPDGMRVKVDGDTWFNFRIQYYTVTSESYGVAAIYVNGELVHTAAVEISPEDFSHVGFILNKQTKSRDVFFDNTTCIATAESYDGTVPELKIDGRAPGKNFVSGGLSFDNMSDAYNGIDKGGTGIELPMDDRVIVRNQSTTSPGNTTYAYLSIASDDGGKSLLYAKINNSYQGEIYVKNVVGAGSVYIFETGMKLGEVVGLENEENKWVLRVALAANYRTGGGESTPKMYTTLDILANNDGTFTIGELTVSGDEWIRFTAKYDLDNDKVIYSINEKVIITEEFTADVSGTPYLALLLRKEASEAKVYFDNMCFSSNGTGSGDSGDDTITGGGDDTDEPTPPETPKDVYDGEYFTEYGGLVYNDADSAKSLAVEGLAYGCNRNNINKHSLAGYMIYDSSSTATTDDRAYLNIITDPCNAANKVLIYHKYDTKDTTPLVFTTNKSNLKSGNCLVFETKIMIKSAETSALESYATQTYKEAFAIELGKTYTSTNASGQTVYSTGSGASDTTTRGLITACISIVADSSADSGYRFCVAPYQFVNTLDKGGEIKTDEWHTLRVETYGNGISKYYVDGVYIYSKTIKSDGIDIGATYDSVLVRPRGGLNNGFGAYFDDTFVGIIEKEYTAN